VNKHDHHLFTKALGKHLRHIRKEKGLSMEQLAYKAEMEYRQLGRIERGEVSATVVTLLRLAEALEVDIKEFFNFNK